MKFKRFFSFLRLGRTKPKKSLVNSVGTKELQFAQAELECSRRLVWRHRVKSHPSTRRELRSVKRQPFPGHLSRTAQSQGADISWLGASTATVHCPQPFAVTTCEQHKLLAEQMPHDLEMDIASEKKTLPSSAPLEVLLEQVSPTTIDKSNLKSPSRPLPPTPVSTTSILDVELVSNRSTDNTWATELSSLAFLSDATGIRWDEDDGSDKFCAREMFSVKRNSQLNVMARISEESLRHESMDASSKYDSSCSSFVSAPESLQHCQSGSPHVAKQSDIMREEKYNLSFEDWEALANEIAQAINLDSPRSILPACTSRVSYEVLPEKFASSKLDTFELKVSNCEAEEECKEVIFPIDTIVAIVSSLSLSDLWLNARFVSRAWKVASERVARSISYVDDFCSLYLKEVGMNAPDQTNVLKSGRGCDVQKLFCEVRCLSVSGTRALLKIEPCHAWQPTRLSLRPDHYAGLLFQSQSRWAETSGNLADNLRMTITVDLDKTYDIMSQGA